MRQLVIMSIGLLTAGMAFASSHHNSYHAPRSTSYGAPSYHRGYVKKNGTYVAPHFQTAPNSTRLDNWSSKPNVNPYTGKVGTKDPYAPSHGSNGGGL